MRILHRLGFLRLRYVSHDCVARDLGEDETKEEHKRRAAAAEIRGDLIRLCRWTERAATGESVRSGQEWGFTERNQVRRRDRARSRMFRRRALK